MNSTIVSLENLDELVGYLRSTGKKNTLLYAYNGTGKTRLSMAFKDAGKMDSIPDTLYYNAFTEDLFSWDNDLDSDSKRVLLINKESRFFSGLEDLEMESRIRPLLQRYADFNFLIDYDYKDKEEKEYWAVNFIREIKVDGSPQNKEFIKISRGEENIFIWCFFLAIAQLAIDQQEDYKWVKYIYIDDPISSLDDNNAIAVASHLAQMLKKPENKIKAVISTHHTLFFNVMYNEMGNALKFFLSKGVVDNSYMLKDTTDTPFFHHVSLLKDLKKAADSGNLYTYHFNILRSILEKTATFHGFSGFSECIKKQEDDPEGVVHTRIVNILSHGSYSLFEPVIMIDENKEYFKRVLKDFMNNYKFNPKLFSE